MKAAVISDIHDNYHNLTLCLQQLRKYDIEKLFFLGDFINAGIALTIAEFEVPSFAIWGNNDGDKAAIMRVALSQRSNLTIGFDTYSIVEFNGRKLFLTHFPLIVHSMAKSGDYDGVFYGHNHKSNIEKQEGCLILNPGELSAHKTGSASFALYDTDTNNAEVITVEGDQVTVFTETVQEFRKTIRFEI